ncbi:bile acid:sodium symporter family protein [Propionicicella superfundia]|uniref:bile acid:sodium symporter family protein n=1 Tax=Propionicicella superfundia TaxID=348582 RepID=UPI0003FCAFA9|nr:bile acid:sodium symporter family protein [Propionicicella superfundia]
MARRRLRVDWFLVGILAAAVLASFLPARGIAIPVVDVATKVAVAGLFFVHGVRLHPREALRGLTHWRLHLTILSFTYVAFPLIGLGLDAVLPRLINPTLAAGMLFLSLVPSTVQSSIAFTSIAKGNVAGAIVSASASNLIGVVLTPLLTVALMNVSGGASVDPGSVIDIMAQILLPFVVGQVLRRWLAEWVARHPRLKLFDQASIVLVVYAAFSEGVREHMWQRVSLLDVAVLVAACVAILVVMLTATWYLPGLARFTRADRIAIQFCGTKKSLASGLPMATVLFAGQDVGLLILPLMLFHQLQLMTCGWLAGRYGRSAPPEPELSDAPGRPTDPR